MTRSVDEKLIRDAAGSVDGLLTLLVEGLDWPLPAHLDTIPLLDWSPEELGLDPAKLGRLTAIRQVPKLNNKQPFGVFVLTFDGGRLPIGALRRVVGQVVRKQRRRRTAADSQWDLGDLVFFCHNDDGHGSVHVVALRDVDGKQDIRTISWTTDPTPTRMALLREHALPDLFWPDSDVVVEEWRTQWRSAFTAGYREGVKTAAALSQRMAEVAGDIRQEIADLLAVESDTGALHQLLAEIKTSLDAATDEAKFADMFAQTLVYGLLSARVSHPDQFHAAEANTLVDFENPFLDAVYGRFRHLAEDSLDLDHLGLTDLAHTLAATNVDELLSDFGAKDRKEDPVIYLYETFLDLYDKEQRKRLGAYYTPVPVVAAMVRLIDDILVHDLDLPGGIGDQSTWSDWAQAHPGFGIPAGVASDDSVVSMIDPATGTGTYLLEWLRRLRDRGSVDLGRALDHMAAIELSLASY